MKCSGEHLACSKSSVVIVINTLLIMSTTLFKKYCLNHNIHFSIYCIKSKLCSYTLYLEASQCLQTFSEPTSTSVVVKLLYDLLCIMHFLAPKLFFLVFHLSTISLSLFPAHQRFSLCCMYYSILSP